MENITMITTAYEAALVPSADAFGGPAGVLVARDRTRATSPRTADVSDPRPVGPPV